MVFKRSKGDFLLQYLLKLHGIITVLGEGGKFYRCTTYTLRFHVTCLVLKVSTVQSLFAL